jgi:hypothetical protein
MIFLYLFLSLPLYVLSWRRRSCCQSWDERFMMWVDACRWWNSLRECRSFDEQYGLGLANSLDWDCPFLYCRLSC